MDLKLWIIISFLAVGYHFLSFITCIFLLGAFIFQVCLINHRKYSPNGKERISGLKLNDFALTLMIIRMAWRNTRNKDVFSRNQFIFHFICGYCHLFRKEGICSFWKIKPVVLLYKAETVGLILNNTESLGKGFEYCFLGNWLKGLLISKGKKWRYTRKLLTPVFHFQSLGDHFAVFNQHAVACADKIATMMQSQNILDVFQLMPFCSLDVLCEATMGKKLNALVDKNCSYNDAVHECCKLMVERLSSPWQYPDVIFFRSKRGKAWKRNLDIMDKFVRQVVDEKLLQRTIQRESEANNLDNQKSVHSVQNFRKKRAYLDLLLDVHFKDPNFTLENVIEEVQTLMFAGSDTTAANISWALYMVGLFPDVQRKVHEEIDYVLGEDVRKPITEEDIKELKYLECVLKETRRLFPTVPYISRTMEKDTIIGDYTIPKGTSCGIFIYMLHRDPRFFPNPEKFDPDRFYKGVITEPFAYIPFSAGPKNCIGQRFGTIEAIIFVSTILRRFKVKSILPLDKIRTIDEIVIKSENGLPMNFQLRQVYS